MTTRTWTTQQVRDLIAAAYANGGYDITNGKWGVDHDAAGATYADQWAADPTPTDEDPA